MDSAECNLFGQEAEKNWSKTDPSTTTTVSTTMVAHTGIQELLELETPGQLFKPGRSGASEKSGESQASEPC